MKMDYELKRNVVHLALTIITIGIISYFAHRLDAPAKRFVERCHAAGGVVVQKGEECMRGESIRVAP